MATKNILVADPDLGVSALLAFILGEAGYDVTTAGSLEEAANRLSRSHFDLIITEAFEQTDTFQFDPVYLAHFRSVAGHAPIVLCSTYGYGLRDGDWGLAAVLTKPFHLDDLLQKVARVLG